MLNFEKATNFNTYGTSGHSSLVSVSLPTRRSWVRVPLPAPNIMTDLADKKCIPLTRGGIPNFDITEIHKYLKMVDGWKVEVDENKFTFLLKEFRF